MSPVGFQEHEHSDTKYQNLPRFPSQAAAEGAPAPGRCGAGCGKQTALQMTDAQGQMGAPWGLEQLVLEGLNIKLAGLFG